MPGKKIKNLGIPHGALIATIIRENDTVIPRGDVEILANDRLIICAEAVQDEYLSDLKEIELKKNHKWNGMKISELDISRQSYLVLIERDNKMIVPNGNVVLREGDKILLYTKENISKYVDEISF